MSSNTSIRIAQGLGITASAFLAGTLYTLSTLAIPAMLAPSPSSPTILLKQWHHLFENGKKMGPAFALVGAVNYLYLAYKAYYGETGKRGIGARVGGGMWKSYLGAAVGTVGIVPFTIIFMNSTNQELLAQAARLTLGEGEIRGLLEKWAGLNLMRAVIPAVGTALGLFGAL